MENASKALIIAGAILLSILIISLGIMIYNQAAGVVNNNAMDEVEIAQFNQKFTQYEGQNIRGAQVNSLLSAIATNNVSNQDDSSKQVSVTVSATNWQSGSKPTGVITSASVKALTGKMYKVTCTPDSKTGLITGVKIEDGGTTNP